MKKDCNCDDFEVCDKCCVNPDRGVQPQDLLLKRLELGAITTNHFFKAKDLDEPLNYICNDKDCQYCRNR